MWFYEVSFNIRKYLSCNEKFISCKEAVSNGDETNICVKKVLVYTFYYYKQPLYKQLELDLKKVKQVLGLKHVTISNFANKIFAYENIATTLYNHILYTANVNQYIVQNGCHSFF